MLPMTDYCPRMRQLFAAPLHAGTLAGPRSSVQRGGLAVELSTELAGPRLARLAFRVYGCPHMIAAAEAFCDRFEGKSVADLAEFDLESACHELEIPVEKTGRILLLEDAIHALRRECAAHRD